MATKKSNSQEVVFPTATSFKAMAADPKIPVARKDFFVISDPRVIKEKEGFNLRDYSDPDVIAQIEAFAKSYAEKKFVPPVVLYVGEDGYLYPIEGHLRRRGALLAQSRGFDVEMTAVPTKGQTLGEQIEVMLRSEQGLKIKPLDQAFGYLRLKEGLGYTNEQIANAVNKTEARVEQLLLLAKADTRIHDMITSGVVTADTVIEILRDHKDDAYDYLQQLYVVAKESGKSKVTRAVTRGVSLPAKVLTTVVGSVSSVVASLDKKTLKELASFEDKEPEELKGKKIEVDAFALMQLMKASQEVEDVNRKREEKLRNAAAKEAQQDMLDASEHVE